MRPEPDDMHGDKSAVSVIVFRPESAFSGALTGFGSDIQDLGVVDMSTTFSILPVIAAVRAAPS